MFNSLLREIEEDSFFSDPFQAHNEHFRQLMRSFSEPFGGHLMTSLTDGRRRGFEGHPSSNLGLRDDRRGMSQSLSPFGSTDNTDVDLRNPFSMFDNMMSMRSRMEDMHRNFENLSTDSNTHSFSSSSVVTYSKVGNEPPKVFQASSQTRRAPGGIKETRRALKDSESGLEKMSIGHHIQDRGHIVEKKHNKKTGEREFNQDFQNLDESEARSFDEEWQRELSKFQPSVSMSCLEAPKPRAAHRTAAEHTQREKPKIEDRKQVELDDINVKGSNIKK